MISMFFIFNNMPEQIGAMFESFNKDFQSFNYAYNKIMCNNLQFIRPTIYSEDEVKQNQDAL